MFSSVKSHIRAVAVRVDSEPEPVICCCSTGDMPKQVKVKKLAKLRTLDTKPGKSQNHRIVGVGRDHCGSSSPTLLLKQGHPQQAAQDLVQVGLEYLQRRRLHNLPGQPVPGLRHPQREEVLPRVQTELPVPQFVPIAPCPVTGHHWKELGPILLTPTLQIFISIY